MLSAWGLFFARCLTGADVREHQAHHVFEMGLLLLRRLAGARADLQPVEDLDGNFVNNALGGTGQRLATVQP